MSDGRDASPIPESVKRALRQESGFGCCVCGNPVIEYHHIRGRRRPDAHEPADMMALCPAHHDMCTRHALTEAEQRALKANPINIERGYVDGRLKVDQDYCAIALGSNTFFDKSIPFSVDGTPLLAISVVERRLSLDLSLFGDQDDLLVEIAANDWISGDSLLWDLWSSYQKLKVRTKTGDIRLGIDATKMPMELRAKLMKNGKIIDIRPSGIKTHGHGGGLSMDSTAICGVEFDFDTKTGMVTAQGGGSTGGIITIELDPAKRLAWGLATMADAES